MAIAALQVQRVEPAVSCNVSISGTGVKSAVGVMNFLRAVAAAQVNVTAEICKLNLSVSGMQVNAALARHVDRDVHTRTSVEGQMFMGKSHENLDSVACLVLFDLESVGPDLEMRADD